MLRDADAVRRRIALTGQFASVEAIRAIRAGAVEGAHRGAANEVNYLKSLFKAA